MTVSVWVKGVPSAIQPDDVSLLDGEETARARRFSSSQAGAWFVGTRALVKRLVAETLDVPSHRISLGRLACPRCGDLSHGPPAVVAPDNELAVSWSRAGPAAAVAIGTREVSTLGIDIERVDKRVDLQALTSSILSPTETLALSACQSSAARDEFILRCWTRKEAALKAAGIGIVTDLTELDVEPTASPRVVTETRAGIGPKQWLLLDLLLQADSPSAAQATPLLMAALAVPADAELTLAVYVAPTAELTA